MPSHKVYEDENFLAFLDINPGAPGQTLVIPKKHYRWVWDLPSQTSVPGNIGQYFAVVQKVALAMRAAFGTEWILSKVVGEEVPHAHIWVFPDREVKADLKDFVGNAEKIKKEIE